MKKYFVISIIFSLALVCNAQEIAKYSIAAKTHYGFIAPHRKGFANLITGHVPILEIDFEQQTNGAKFWHNNFKLPTTGVAIFQGSFGNKEHLGYFTSISPYIGFPVVNKKVKLYLRFGSGLGYVSKPFDLATNYKNDLLGSHLNVFFNFQTEVSIPLSNKMNISSGFSFSHLSNGAYALPNLGINIPSAFVGLKYNINHQNIEEQNLSNRDSYKINILTDLSLGFKEHRVDEAKKIGFNFNILGWKSISKTSSIGIGTDLFYNSALNEYFEESTSTAATFGNILRHGVSLGYKVNISKVQLYFQFGGYTYAKENNQGLFYQKIGGYIWLTDKLYFTGNLKVHYAVADFFQFGIGYKLWKK